jgi:ankyrin repeat protein
MVELLVKHGADVARPRSDGRTPFAVAELSGNGAAADWLSSHGAPTALSRIDQFVALCGRGDRTAALTMLRENPGLREQLGPEHYAGLYRAAEIGDTRVIETMLACGFEPNHPDEEMGKTPLHEAAHGGRADAVRVLLAHGASVSVRDREFHGPPLVWAADGLRTRGEGDGREFGEVARLLLAAGSPVEWEPGAEPAAEIVEIIDSWKR